MSGPELHLAPVSDPPPENAESEWWCGKLFWRDGCNAYLLYEAKMRPEQKARRFFDLRMYMLSDLRSDYDFVPLSDFIEMAVTMLQNPPEKRLERAKRCRIVE